MSRPPAFAGDQRRTPEEWIEEAHRLSPFIGQWIPALLPLVRKEVGYLMSPHDVFRAAVEAAMWAHPKTRPALIDAVVQDELDKVDRELDIQPTAEPYDKRRLRWALDDAMADLPDDFTTG